MRTAIYLQRLLTLVLAWWPDAVRDRLETDYALSDDPHDLDPQTGFPLFPSRRPRVLADYAPAQPPFVIIQQMPGLTRSLIRNSPALVSGRYRVDIHAETAPHRWALDNLCMWAGLNGQEGGILSGFDPSRWGNQPPGPGVGPSWHTAEEWERLEAADPWLAKQSPGSWGELSCTRFLGVSSVTHQAEPGEQAPQVAGQAPLEQTRTYRLVRTYTLLEV